MTNETTDPLDWLAESVIAYLTKTGSEIEEIDLDDWLRDDIEHHGVASGDVDKMMADGRTMAETLQKHCPDALVSPTGFD